jgi:hypothetical protein
MDFVLLFLMAFGLTFGLQNNKARFLTDRLKTLRFRVRTDDEGTETTFFQRMLVCPYCTGFHAGWIAWLAVRLPVYGAPFDAAAAATAIAECVASAFAAAAFCYLADTLAQVAEDASGKLTSEE